MKYVKLFLLVAVALFAVNAIAFAEPAAQRERVDLEFRASKYFSLDKKISRIFVGSKKIIKVTQTGDTANEFVVTAQTEKGSTTLFVWTDDGARHEYLVNVVDEEIGQAEIIEEAIREELNDDVADVHVKKVGNKILLTGTVRNSHESESVVQIARLYISGASNSSSRSGDSGAATSTTSTTSISGPNLAVALEQADLGNIINQLHILETTPQIRLEAQIIAIRPQDTKRLGFQYNGTTAIGDSAIIGNSGIFYGGETYKNGTSIRDNPWKWFIGNRAQINYSLNALTTTSKAKLLSRPSIMTMSGETATIRIGGEIPYRVLDNNGNASTEFKDYGIILRFKPVVDQKGRILSSVYTEVSSMSGESVDGNPILDTRSANTNVILEDGYTMVIGGLMDSSERKSVSKIPLLGDIPILGEFFKYTSKTKDDQELVILVTPYIVEMENTTHAGMSDEMRDFYNAGQRKKNSMNDVDLNALPPPFPENDKDKKNNKKSKKDKTAKTKKDTKPEVVITDTPPQHYDDDQNVEVFGGNY